MSLLLFWSVEWLSVVVVSAMDNQENEKSTRTHEENRTIGQYFSSSRMISKLKIKFTVVVKNGSVSLFFLMSNFLARCNKICTCAKCGLFFDIRQKPFTCSTGRNGGRTFFKIIDATVVVAYPPLLINDRFCSRTSSSRCRQYCFSSLSLSLSLSLCPLHSASFKQTAASIREEQKIGKRKKHPEIGEEEK